MTKKDVSLCPIRPMDIGDWAACWDLHSEHAAPLPPLWRILRRTDSAAPKVHGLVAYDGPNVIGYAMWRATPSRVAECLALVVAEPRRRLGIGMRLLGRIVQAAAGRHLAYASAAVDDRNIAAQVWLRACGWRACGMIAPGSTMIDFRRELRSPYTPIAPIWEEGCNGK